MVKHLACIMDGNRRWAKKRGWLSWDGHREGLKAAQRTIDFCLDSDISYLSLYTFSLENFKRPPKELNFLFNVLIKEMHDTLMDDMQKKGVRIQFVGDRAQFPDSVLSTCESIEEKTKAGTALQVNLLFCYGGQQEIMHGIKNVVKKIAGGALKANELTSDLFASELWTSGTPAPDLIIRTGGVQRLSNFLLFQAAYSEFYFTDCLWPDITSDHLNKALSSFAHTERNFGV